MEARQRCLLDQPIAVLRCHAEECGIDVTSCIEKEELVRRILQVEPADFASGAPVQAHDLSEEQQRRLQEDEQLARRLQAEEQARAETGSRERHRALAQMLGAPRGRAAAGAGGAPGQREAIEGLLQQLQELRGRVPTRPRNDQRPMEFSNTGAEARQREAQEEAAAEHPVDPVGGTREAGGTHRVQLTPQSLAGLFAAMGQEEEGGADGARALPLLAHLLQQLTSLQTGLDPAVVDQLTAVTTYEATESDKLGDGVLSKCMVCLESFKAGEEIRILPCLHRFHKGCVDEWLARSAECPICKFNITTESESGGD
mmetsp:Transcript_17895/g.32468  ORF Transcript_17895/g.32468 Transcript_17895/m.32468 type:complete len:314 (-) Transcript_17895:114-1055(-)